MGGASFEVAPAGTLSMLHRSVTELVGSWRDPRPGSGGSASAAPGTMPTACCLVAGSGVPSGCGFVRAVDVR